MRLPSIKTLARIESNEGDARVIAKRLRKALESAHSWENALTECDAILNTHGVESIEFPGEPFYTDEGMRFCGRYSYCNTGDTYAVTVIRDHKRGTWLVCSWGDLVEARGL